MSDRISPFAEWHEVRDQLVPFIGERALALFAQAIFDECGGAAGAEWFRRSLIDSGTDVDDPQVTETERLLIDWGRLVARDARGLDTHWREQFESTFSPALRQLLVRFAALSMASAVVDNVGFPESVG